MFTAGYVPFEPSSAERSHDYDQLQEVKTAWGPANVFGPGGRVDLR